jgi:hypothetical protein
MSNLPTDRGEEMTCWICGSPSVGTGQHTLSVGISIGTETVGVCSEHIPLVVLYKPFVDEDYEQAVADLQPVFKGEEMTDKELMQKLTHIVKFYHVEKWAEEIFKVFKDAGYVKLAENQELPNVHSFVAIEAETAGAIVDVGSYQKQAQQDMLKAGFRRVEL